MKLDLFTSMTPEEYAVYQGPTEEEIREALRKGREERDRCERAWRGVTTPQASLPELEAL